MYANWKTMDNAEKWKATDNTEHKEAVDHPDHYKAGNLECIDVMEEIFGKEAVKNFCQLNAFKYLWRSTKKNGSEDIAKAKWYLNKFDELGEE